MARNSPIITTAALCFIVVLFVVAVYSPAPVIGLGGVIGGRTKITNVKSNVEVQDLGRYSVQEYNRRQRRTANGGGGDLTFTAVVEAEKQVVSGIKYYLKIATTSGGGVKKTFDAEVVVKQWAHSKDLLKFAPSPPRK